MASSMGASDVAFIDFWLRSEMWNNGKRRIVGEDNEFNI